MNVLNTLKNPINKRRQMPSMTSINSSKILFPFPYGTIIIITIPTPSCTSQNLQFTASGWYLGRQADRCVPRRYFCNQPILRCLLPKRISFLQKILQNQWSHFYGIIDNFTLVSMEIESQNGSYLPEFTAIFIRRQYSPRFLKFRFFLSRYNEERISISQFK